MAHPTLQELGLDSIAVNVDGWREVFAGMGRARVPRLVLESAGLTDAGMAALCRGLRVNASVTSLELDHNAITLNGLLDLRAAMRVNYSVSHLPLPIFDLAAIQDKPGSSKWAQVQAVAADIAHRGGLVLWGRGCAVLTFVSLYSGCQRHDQRSVAFVRQER
jgi:hypothetical protein